MLANHIIIAICNEFNVTKNEVFSESRKEEVVNAKQTISFSLHYLGFTQKTIAEIIGYSDHTTVNYHINKKSPKSHENRLKAIRTVEAYLPMALYKIGRLKQKYESFSFEEE
jgi:chromosomal replication initiation ATPase DnaA